MLDSHKEAFSHRFHNRFGRLRGCWPLKKCEGLRIIVQFWWRAWEICECWRPGQGQGPHGVRRQSARLLFSEWLAQPSVLLKVIPIFPGIDLIHGIISSPANSCLFLSRVVAEHNLWVFFLNHLTMLEQSLSGNAFWHLSPNFCYTTRDFSWSHPFFTGMEITCLSWSTAVWYENLLIS